MRPSMASAGPQHLVIHSLRRIANWIESNGRSDQGIVLRNALVFIDLFDKRLNKFEELDPLALNKGNWSATVAMLLLAFPEMHWVLNTPYKTLENALFKNAHLLGEGNRIARIVELRDADYSALFDPAGLRLTVRRELSKKEEAKYVPRRCHIAAAIDEEDDYAYFNGYMAYRLGYRCHVISSYMMMTKVLERPDDVKPLTTQAIQKPDPLNPENSQAAQPQDHNETDDEHVTLIFEDLYLNFSDHRDPNLHLSDLRKRSEKFKALDDRCLRRQFRAFVTVGHDITAHKDLVKENDKFKTEWEKKTTKRKVGGVFKPVSGFFHLWEESGFLAWSKKQSWNGYGADYVWPPLNTGAAEHLPEQSEPDETPPDGAFYSDHSAPGRLLEIAERLLYRTELNSEHVHTVPEAVYGSTLALEAQEYLGHRTPTTSLQALALKHKFEVNAECLFYGVAQNKEVKKRFAEIEREIVSIGHWLNPETRKAAQMDAEMSIVSKLMLVFRQNYQFDEEQECLKKLRNVNRQLWSRKRLAVRSKQVMSSRSPFLDLLGLLGWLFHWPVRGGRSYVERLVNSVALFCGAIVGWVFVLSFLYGYLCGCTSERSQTGYQAVQSASRFHSSEAIFIPAVQRVIYYAEQGLMHAMTAFFGLQPPHPVETLEQYGPLPLLVTIVAIGLGFVHLGIFISHVYSVISRR